MSTKKRLDVVATVGEYQKDGQTKKRYAKCGSAFVDEKGEISIKMDTIPACDWNGWFSLKEPYEGERPARQSSEPTRQTRGRSTDGFDQDVPF